MAKTALPQRRSALIRMNTSDIAGLLDLPDDLTVTAVQGRFDPPQVIVRVEGPSLGEVSEGAESPYMVPGMWAREEVMFDGKTYTRFGWERDA